jgi:galactose mutarotase-like enzyme
VIHIAFGNFDKRMNLKTIENDFLKLSISDLGAEMKSLLTKKDNKEWLWQADPEYWPRTAPILFPIVGKLADNQYLHHEHPYPLSQHGFARDRIFENVESHPEHTKFKLVSDYESRKFYPFDFELFVGYNLAKNWLWIEYEVLNTGTEEMFFSVGAHPGFALPGWPHQKYYINFEEPDILNPYLLNNGLLQNQKDSEVEIPNNELLISNSLFEKDALVLDQLRSTWVGIRSEALDHNLKVHFEGFPYLGLWAKPGAPFVCIEPWYGHADFVGLSGEISKKPAILQLKPEQNFHCRFAIEILNF